MKTLEELFRQPDQPVVCLRCHQDENEWPTQDRWATLTWHWHRAPEGEFYGGGVVCPTCFTAVLELLKVEVE